jgi:hypothetical protein
MIRTLTIAQVTNKSLRLQCKFGDTIEKNMFLWVVLYYWRKIYCFDSVNMNILNVILLTIASVLIGLVANDHVTAEQCDVRAVAACKHYVMYVLTSGFNHNVPGCDKVKFLEWNTKGPCFTHVWNTKAKRDWLWATCNLHGRELDTIFVNDVHHNLKKYTTQGIEFQRR